MKKRRGISAYAGCVAVCACVVLCACNRPAEHARRLVDRGTALVDAEQYEEALKLFRMAVDADPEYEDAHLQMALLFDTYLHDTSNAVAAYERYMKTAKNETMRENARRWLESARETRSAARTVAPAAAPGAQLSLEEELAKRDLQFEAVRRQTAERYERELEIARQDARAAQEKLAALEKENLALRSAGTASTRAELLDALASNRQIVATLQQALREKEEAMQESRRGQEMLQAMVTNLQAELALRDDVGSVGVAFNAATNQLAELRRIASERTKQYEESMQALAEERSTRTALEAQLRVLQQRYEGVQQQYAQADTRRLPSRASEIPGATLAPVTAAQQGIRTVPQAVTRVAAAASPGNSVARSAPAVSVAPGANVVVPQAPSQTRAGRVYTVQTGDSLMKIARDLYGDGNRWTVIFNANRDILERPNQLRVGQVLRIP